MFIQDDNGRPVTVRGFAALYGAEFSNRERQTFVAPMAFQSALLAIERSPLQAPSFAVHGFNLDANMKVWSAPGRGLAFEAGPLEATPRNAAFLAFIAQGCSVEWFGVANKLEGGVIKSVNYISQINVTASPSVPECRAWLSSQDPRSTAYCENLGPWWAESKVRHEQYLAASRAPRSSSKPAATTVRAKSTFKPIAESEKVWKRTEQPSRRNVRNESGRRQPLPGGDSMFDTEPSRTMALNRIARQARLKV